MRRNRTLPALPQLLPRRVRLVKLLRAHGLRDAERLREDELLGALSRLKIVLPSEAPIAFASPLPTSGQTPEAGEESTPSPVVPPGPGASPVEASDAHSEGDGAEDLYDDPHALARFLEPKIFIPAGERTFLRLIAVDPHTLFVAWELDDNARSLVDGQVFIDLVRLDQDGTQRMPIDLRPGGWYLRAPEAGATVVARLGCESATGDRVIVESNPAVVLPNRAQEGGEVVFATIPARTDRKALVGGKLTEEGASLPEGVETKMTGEQATLPPHDRQVVAETNGAGAPGEAVEDALPTSSAFAPLPTSPHGARS